MCSPRINGEGELRGQPANPGSPGKMAVKTECVWTCLPQGDLPTAHYVHTYRSSAPPGDPLGVFHLVFDH